MDKLMRQPKFVLIAVIWALSACTAPLPTATPEPPTSAPPTTTPSVVPQATATPLPLATPAPQATPLPTPEPSPTPASGFFRDSELGFWFKFPDDWSVENTSIGLPAVIVSDPDDPVKVMAGATIIEGNLTQEAFAEAVVDDLGLGESASLVSTEARILDDGSAAQSISITWEEEDGVEMLGQGMVTVSNGYGYLVLLYGRPEVIEARPQTVQAISGSFHLEQPELFGISRENALVLSSNEPTTLDPALTHEKASGIVGHVFSGLVRLNLDLGLDPDLAESWDISEDGLVYTFHLREDAQFHDGELITAADVKASWERASDPELHSPTAAHYLGDILGVSERLNGEADDITGLEVLDPHTLQVTIDSPKPYFLYRLAQPVTFVVDEENPNLGNQWWRQPNGTGPFKLRSWRPDRVIVLDQNLAYSPSPPDVESVIYYLGESGLPAYEAGQVDAAQVGYWNLSRAQDPGEPASVDLHSGHRLCTQLVVFDTTSPPFDDPAVRRAFSLAVDRERLVADVLQDAAVPATGILPPGMPGYVERPVSYGYDLTRVDTLISESSYGDAAALPNLTLMATGVGSPEPLVTALVDQWRGHFGMEIETELLDRVDFPDLISERQVNMVLLDWCADYPDPENMLDTLFHSSGYSNIGGYRNQEVDGLLERARTETDNEVRLGLYQQAEALILDDAPAIELVHPQNHILIRPFIQRFALSPIEVVWPAYVSIEREE